MQLSEQTDKLFKALVKFQKDVPTITKDRTVKVKNKTGKFLYSFDYATLGNIINTTKPVLAEAGLSVTQSVGSEGVKTIISHESGQFLITDALGVDLDGDEQDQGSSITYKKRYQLSGALNLDSEFDDDGNVASGNVPDYSDNQAEAQDDPIKGKGGSSTKPKKTKAKSKPEPEPEPEQEEEPPFEVDANDMDELVANTLDNVKDPMDLIDWWKKFLDEGDEDKKHDKYRDDVMDRLQELQSPEE